MIEVGQVLAGEPVVGKTSKQGAPVQDAAVARASGLRAPVVPNLLHFAQLTELLLHHFGDAWRTNGEIDVRYVSFLYAGDTLRPSARVTAVEPSQGGIRVRLDVSCENQAGVVLATGTAECLLAAGS